MPARQRPIPFPSLFAVVAVLTVGISLLGGASRGDVATNAMVQLLGTALIFSVCLVGRWATIARETRQWIGLLLLLTVWIALQLVPLPPSLWASLPGRSPYVAEAAIVGIAQPWRPISLSPMDTWVSLVGMTVPIGLLLGWGSVNHAQLRAGLWILVGVMVASVLLGLAQISSGGLYLFQNSNAGFPTGLFVNRNHQAAALALTFPLMGVAILEARIERHRSKTLLIAACAAACLVLPMLLVNGSRAGLALAASAIVLTVVMAATYRVPGHARATRRERLVVLAALLTPFVVATLAFLLGRAAAIERLTRLRIEDDQRYRQAATVIEMIRAHFPVGAGYGSFPQVFRVYEPFTSLKFTYFNRAHNDLLELAFEGGLPSVLLAVAATALFTRQAWWVWTTKDRGRTTLYARAATIMLVILVLASVGDYPLRTPTILVFATIAITWLSAGAALLKSDQGPL